MTLPPAESPLRLRGRDIAQNQVPRPLNQPPSLTQEQSQSGSHGPNSELELTRMMSLSIF